MAVTEIACMACNHVFSITSLGEVIGHTSGIWRPPPPHVINVYCSQCNHAQYVQFRPVVDRDDFNKP
jgi:hypothetical protein